MWRIALLENTVTGVTKELAEELINTTDAECIEDIWNDHNNTFYFNDDWFEHMDWLCHNKRAHDIIDKHGLSGTVKFGSLNGDNSGEFWGVEFTDNGLSAKTLRGDIVWSVVD